MDTKIDWKDTDYVNVTDFNRIRSNLAQISGDFVYGPPEFVDASYIISADDIFELRSRYEIAAGIFGVLSNDPNSSSAYSFFDPLTIRDTFPRLRWLCTWKGDYNFPAAWELNLYERLCRYVDQNALQQSSVLHAGGLVIPVEVITLST